MINVIKTLIFASIIALVAACTPHPKEQETKLEPTIEVLKERCFLQVTGKDSLFVKLSVVGNNVTGILNWLPSEKDKMIGTLVGTLQDDIVTAVYSYSAEGVSANEQKIIKLQENNVLIKTGELEKQNDLWVIKDKENAIFSEAIPKVACP